MTGWRVGWIYAPPPMIEALTAYCGTAFFGCSQFIQDAAAYALRHNGPHVDRMCEAYRERRDLVVNRLDKIDRLSYVRPLKMNKTGAAILQSLVRDFGGTMPATEDL